VEAKVSEDIFKKSCATPVASMFLWQGEMITPFVSPWSTMTMMESKPDERGRSVIRSMETCWKGRVIEEARGVRGGGGVGVHLVCLANGTTSDKAVDKWVKTQPPKVLGDKVLGAEDSTMAPSVQLMESSDDIAAGPLRYIKVSLEVKLPLLVEAVLSVGAGEGRGSLNEGLEGRERKGV
jgi:hypothetical protein